MTAAPARAARPAPAATRIVPPPDRDGERAARLAAAARRSRRSDVLEAVAWLMGVGAVAFMLASGTVDVTTPAGLLISLGRLSGMVASTLIMVQLVLIARIPPVERLLGHDRAARVHGRLGRLGFLVILAHVALLVLGYAGAARLPVMTQTWELVVGYGGPMFLAWVGMVALIAVVVTSYAIVRRRWRYESWHAVHVFSYVAIGLSIPHQLTDGETFMTMGLAWWYWMLLWSVAIGGLIVFRVVRPLARYRRHRVRVAAVGTMPDGSTVIAMHGRRLSRLGTRGGQFFLFRVLAPGIWGQAHPYSPSRTVRDGWMRITVKHLGDGSAALADLTPGTRVMLEGPLGTFTAERRTGSRVRLE